MLQSFDTNDTKPHAIHQSPISAFKRGKRIAHRPTTSPVPLELEAARTKYKYNYAHFAPLAMVDKLPKAEIPSLEWWTKVIQVMITIFVNAKMSKRGGWTENNARRNIALLFKQALIDVFWEGGFKTRLRLLWHLLKSVPQLLWKGFTLDIREWQTLILSP
jgi:arachidonate 15-lipoxygenase